MIGLFYEMGALRVGSDKLLRTNMDTWNRNYSMLFIDNPVGTGYSYVRPKIQRTTKASATTEELMGFEGEVVKAKCPTLPKVVETDDYDEYEPYAKYSDGYTTNQAAVASDMLMFLDKFYDVFPELRQAKLVISGESYAGKYVPSVAAAILHRNARVQREALRRRGMTQVNQKQLGMANAIDTNTPENKNEKNSNQEVEQMQGYITRNTIPLRGIAIGNGLTDPLSQIVQHAPQALALGLVSTPQSHKIQDLAFKSVKSAKQGLWLESTAARNELFEYFKVVTGGINWYDVRKGDIPNSWENMNQLLNTDPIKGALNVPFELPYDKDPEVYAHLAEDVMKSAKKYVEYILQSGTVGVLLYQGQFDFRDGILSSNEWIETLEWMGREAYLNASRKIWKLDGHVVGYEREVTGVNAVNGFLKRVEVLHAGHLSPMDAGSATRDMITNFVEGL
jgi:vitellogenic carboxypeptidase-like protein